MVCGEPGSTERGVSGVVGSDDACLANVDGPCEVSIDSIVSNDSRDSTSEAFDAAVEFRRTKTLRGSVTVSEDDISCLVSTSSEPPTALAKT